MSVALAESPGGGAGEIGSVNGRHAADGIASTTGVDLGLEPSVDHSSGMRSTTIGSGVGVIGFWDLHG